MSGRHVRQLLAAVAVFVAVAVTATLLLWNRDGEAPPAAPPPAPSATTTTTTTEPPPPRDRVVVVKIDNVRSALPQTGLGAAEVVYVEPVEGGLTRLAAVYSRRLPDVVGPVRSARETDVQLLAQYGKPSLAFSGAAPEIMPILRRAPLQLATEKSVPGAFFRDPARPRPHNLFARPARLPHGTGPGPRHVFRFGPAPGGGERTASRTVRFESANYTFTWAAGPKRWLVSRNGAPLRSTESGRVSAATVVVQRVTVRQGADVTDATGAVSPVVRSVGRGPATILRNGKAFPVTWSRSGPGAGTRFTTGAGDPVPLARGPVWVLLVPR
ncbi:Protein of unknown function (DUF3048) [Prauserella shujinwangii]|uniref:DUF3048 family protein n=1 Tax=Prauserella shujinwangii TaxID=1453103 RepID=A0A2T0LPQ6_9PSEU|nr:DUF3048 domain-containing protein [Prauserella shujinwangii]PRX45213.1 Protein of unknown function (DUF3048) [Prauserella shujinwangii]